MWPGKVTCHGDIVIMWNSKYLNHMHHINHGVKSSQAVTGSIPSSGRGGRGVGSKVTILTVNAIFALVTLLCLHLPQQAEVPKLETGNTLCSHSNYWRLQVKLKQY